MGYFVNFKILPGIVPVRRSFSEGWISGAGSLSLVLLALGMSQSVLAMEKAMLSAIIEDNVQVVQNLLEKGIGCNAAIDGAPLHWKFIHHAAYYGRAEIVQLLIEYGCDINS